MSLEDLLKTRLEQTDNRRRNIHFDWFHIDSDRRFGMYQLLNNDRMLVVDRSDEFFWNTMIDQMDTGLIGHDLCITKKKTNSFRQNDWELLLSFPVVIQLTVWSIPLWTYFAFLPRKSVYNTVSGVIEAQMRLWSSSPSKHSPRKRDQFSYSI